MKIILRDITQAYTQLKTELNCTVICHLPVKLKKKYPESTILLVVKPLYGLAEVRNHWFVIYFDQHKLAKAENYWFVIYLDHHKEKLGIYISPYDAYLFITKDGVENFGIVGLQIDNTLNVEMEAFIKKEETEIIEAKFKAKIRTILETGASRDFNGYHMTIKAKSIIVVKRNQVEKLVFVDINDNVKKQ